VNDAQVLGALGHVDPDELLDGAAEGHRVEEVGQVVHPLDHRDGLPVRLVLARLLDAGVQVADDRLDVADDLALERDEQPQHAVRGRVVRAHVEREQLGREALGGRLLGVERRQREALLAPAVAGDLGLAHSTHPGTWSSL
jgi:hypothetical protein